MINLEVLALILLTMKEPYFSKSRVPIDWPSSRRARLAFDYSQDTDWIIGNLNHTTRLALVAIRNWLNVTSARIEAARTYVKPSL